MQLVWAVKDRRFLIRPDWRGEVEAIIVWWFNHYKCTSIAVRCMPDHVHSLFEYHPTQSVSKLTMVIKGEVTKFIKQKGFLEDMDWQDGYSLFSYSYRDVPSVKRYIQNQDEHHHSEYRFRREHRDMLVESGQSFEEWLLLQDLYDWADDGEIADELDYAKLKGLPKTY